jgi:tetratricopeptide (TPR) repeat protein
MARVLLSGLAMCLVASAGWAQSDVQQQADSRTVLGGGNELLAAGAEMIRAGDYEDGIRLTMLGLERSPSPPDKAAALSNLCAAHAAKGDPDRAITYCTESIDINEKNWRAYSNRSYAFYLKGMYAQAKTDLEMAAAISPNARQVGQIRGMINERNLRPSVIMEDHR